ncbi:MAG: hypothetical protein KKB03_03140 [Nanoarchaeota archaeon]|nr:hypothetical protein [Nanoarchaeota archaeon]MBU1135334.1 hypothetical protein [Nanoarchaeota archaeon]MBU2520210.1 hypothetical protein [Nanoarchaeota archaeon]
MSLQEINKIVKENKKWTNLFERWDRTGIDPFEEKLVSFSIKKMNHEKLKTIAKMHHTSMSDIIDDLIEKHLSEKL